ncbi:MAG: ATP-binding protein [Bacteroides sp.]|nr:ATP-binding protein [Ruminococcus sp.]MCM1463717.1 ATP-binding protein [Bacteroides sp.]
MKELTVSATAESIAAVTAFVDEQLERLGCPVKTLFQVNVAIDEIFGNIANYAYSSENGAATVRVETAENPPAAVITFIDSGIPYNPLAKADPDVTLSAEERKVGGLGIYMVKKTMDGISYEYKNGQNILRIRKNIWEEN